MKLDGLFASVSPSLVVWYAIFWVKRQSARLSGKAITLCVKPRLTRAVSTHVEENCMNLLAHVTVQETPLWLLVLLVGIGIGMGLAISMIARRNRNDLH
jgi:hypothetical protein